eukprot:3207786-Pleurochrysis_carterae.AAC.1
MKVFTDATESAQARMGATRARESTRVHESASTQTYERGLGNQSISEQACTNMRAGARMRALVCCCILKLALAASQVSRLKCERDEWHLRCVELHHALRSAAMHDGTGGDGGNGGGGGGAAATGASPGGLNGASARDACDGPRASGVAKGQDAAERILQVAKQQAQRDEELMATRVH